jgi:hypothetical protein
MAYEVMFATPVPKLNRDAYQKLQLYWCAAAASRSSRCKNLDRIGAVRPSAFGEWILKICGRPLGDQSLVYPDPRVRAVLEGGTGRATAVGPWS